MSATDELRRMLDERGVEYEAYRDIKNRCITRWRTYHGAFAFFAVEEEGELFVETASDTEHSAICTPDQAIAATLGSNTRGCENLLWELIGALDVADATDASKKPIVTEYARRIAATLGSGKLTADQVRDAVMSADRWEKPIGNTGLTNTHLIIRDDGWQAIADELNATLADDGYERKMDALLCRLTNGKFSKSRAYDLDFMESCINYEFELLYSEGEVAE